MTQQEKDRLYEFFKNSNLSINSINKYTDEYWNKYGNDEILQRFNVILQKVYNILERMKDSNVIEYEKGKLKFRFFPNFCKEGRIHNIKNNFYSPYYWNIITITNTGIITPLFEISFQIGTYKLNDVANNVEFNKTLGLEGEIKYYKGYVYNFELTNDMIDTYYMIPSNIMKEEFNKINKY